LDKTITSRERVALELIGALLDQGGTRDMLPEEARELLDEREAKCERAADTRITIRART
jgi:hypothetical protein